MGRFGRRVFVEVVVGLPLAWAVGLMASRVGVAERFVSWGVVAFSVLAAAVVLLAVWTGSRQPSMLLLGLLPAVVVSYVLPAAPMWFVAVALAGAAILAVGVRGVATGLAAGTAALMVVAVVLQGPAVECGATSVSSNSGPWWVDEPARSSGTGTSSADGVATGTVEVGDGRYEYVCERGALARFERVAAED